MSKFLNDSEILEVFVKILLILYLLLFGLLLFFAGHCCKILGLTLLNTMNKSKT